MELTHNYVGVDNLLQNRAGKTVSNHVPTAGALTQFLKDDILIGNIRPYLKKIWHADCEGGTNGDVLVIRINDENLNARYLYQVLADDKFFEYNMKHAKGAKMPRGDKTAILQYKIPIPPISLQQEIAAILDKFTERKAELQTALQTELALREKQYRYYRDLLLTFDDIGDRGGRANPFFTENVVWKSLGEVVPLQRGKRLVKSQLLENGRYSVFQNSLQPLGYFDEYNCRSFMTFIIAAGAAGEIGFSHQEFWACDDCYYFDCPQAILNDRFLYHFLALNQHKLLSQVRKASVPRLSRNVIEKLRIPIPPLEKQAEIVAILDKFDRLTNSLSEGLPREIELREKQYQYYREKLLNFPK